MSFSNSGSPLDISALQMAGAMLQVPHGRVMTLSYEKAGNKDALLVRFRAPDTDVYEHRLLNENYNADNHALQFLAAVGLRPTDFGEPSTERRNTSLDVSDKKITVPLVRDNDSYFIHQNVLERGEKRLEEADWFDVMGDLRNDVVEVDVGGSDS